MRKIILFMVLSLDGYVCGPHDELDWEIHDPEVGRYMVPHFLKTSTTMLIGRVLFQGFEQAWPMMAKDPNSPPDLIEFAHWVEDTRKIVFSKTIDSVAWKNSQLVQVKTDEDIVKEVKRLKQENDGDMVVFGGAKFAQTLVAHDLVDEYQFKVQPVILGRGKALFKDMAERRKLKLLQAKTFESGVVGLFYERVR